MGTPHINAEKGDFSNVVLIAGDPNRAKCYYTDYNECNLSRSKKCS